MPELHNIQYLSPIPSQGYVGHYSSAHCTTTYQEVCHTHLEEECDCSHPLQVGTGGQYTMK